MAEVAAQTAPAEAAPERTDPHGLALEGYNRVPRPIRLDPAPTALRILFLYSRPPLPITRGDELTVAHLLEFLHARGHVVDFLSIIDKGQRLRPEHQAWLDSRCRSVRFIERHRLAGIWQAGLGFVRGWPLQIGYFYVPAQIAAAEQAAAANDYDLAYAYYIRSAEALRALETRVPTRFLALQLSQTLNTERLAANATRFWERIFYRIEHRRIAAYEARVWQMADRTVLVGEKDRAAIEAACQLHGVPPIDNVVFGPHGVDTERFKPRPAAEEADIVAMSGVMCYAPNIEAALWFLTQVWPKVRARRPKAQFWLVGRDPAPALLAHDGQNGVTVTGTVDEPADWLARATVCVAPIRAAAGLQNKLLEGLAMGKAMIATPEANEGIQAVPDRDLCIEGPPEAFAEAVLGLLADPARRQALGAAGRAFIDAKWTWEAFFLVLEEAFLEAHVAVSPAPPRASRGMGCVALWTRDFRAEANAGRPSIARAISKVMDEFGPTEHIILAHRLGSLRSPATLAGAVGGLLVDRWPLQTLLYGDAAQRHRVLERLRHLQPRTVYLDTVRCMAFARDIRQVLPDCRLVLDMDDLLSRRLEGWRALGAPLTLGYMASSAGRMASLLSAEPARSLLLRYEIGALRRAELLAIDLVDSIVLVSPFEASLLAARVKPTRRATITAVPPARPPCRPLRPRAWPLTFVFIGSDGLLQNRVTIDRLIALWRDSRPTARLEIFGSMRHSYAELPPGVHMRGFVSDLDAVYGPDRVLLAPSYVPGGIKTKVLEAFAHGCPVVGNAATFEGLDLADYPLVCASDAALAALVTAPEAQAAAFDPAATLGRQLLAARHTEAQFVRLWRELLAL